MALRRIEERRQRRVRIIIGVIIVFLMVASGFSVALYGRSANAAREYGVTFTPDDKYNVWHAKIDKQELFFYYLPSSALLVDAPSDLGETIRAAPVIVLTFDPGLSPTNLQYIDLIRLDLAETLPVPVISAVAEENSTYSLPVVSCDNATANMPVLSFEEGEAPEIVIEDACVRLRANNTDFALIRDRLVYEYYDIYAEG
ncbi:hypothetical protein JXA12_04500 [Candidatus Woesearchaeota archaeon]|nr:hypothetical protein [Candidatus Woesearchaeota archaeon]